MKDAFNGKTILVTGGAGSIGKEIVKEVLKHSPKVIRIFDSSENGLFELQEELRDFRNLRFFLGDLRDEKRVSRAIENVDLVFHTASLKHVLICEYNPFEAVKTNVVGTQNLINAAINEEVEKVIFTSSDKAVNPCNAMGASKLLAEKLMVAANYYKGNRRTAFSCVRFGNVMGTSGSVIPLFRQQIQKGGPVTITDRNMTRFIMSMSDALQVILTSVEKSVGGEIFASKMRALNIFDLAEVMIEMLAPRYGFSKDDIQIKEIGIKSGEKIYEELVSEEEAFRSLETNSLYIILPQIEELKANFSGLTPPRNISFKSKDAPLLSKEEIKTLLVNENLL